MRWNGRTRSPRRSTAPRRRDGRPPRRVDPRRRLHGRADVFFRPDPPPDSDAGLELLATRCPTRPAVRNRLLSSPEVAEREAAAFAGPSPRLPAGPPRRRVGHSARVTPRLRAIPWSIACWRPAHGDFAAIAAGAPTERTSWSATQYLRMWRQTEGGHAERSGGVRQHPAAHLRAAGWLSPTAS